MENLRPQAVTWKIRPLREVERLIQETDRGRDAGEQVSAYAESKENVRPLYVRERRRFRQVAGTRQPLDGHADFALASERPRLTEQRANLELRKSGRGDSGA